MNLSMPFIHENTEPANQNQPFQKTESRDRLAAGVAHLFNNSLAAVLVNIEMAMRDLPENEKPCRYLREAVGASCQATEVCRLLLANLSVCLGHAPTERQPLDLSEVCQRFLPALRALVGESTQIKSDLPLSGPLVHVSRDLLQQVFINLINKARDVLGDDRGATVLRVTTFAGSEIPETHLLPIDGQPKNSAFACVEIEHTGCGITDTNFDDLFDPFFSGRFASREPGLSATQGMIRRLGGVILADGKQGRGITFRIFLPVCRTHPPPAEIVTGRIAAFSAKEPAQPV